MKTENLEEIKKFLSGFQNNKATVIGITTNIVDTFVYIKVHGKILKFSCLGTADDVFLNSTERKLSMEVVEEAPNKSNAGNVFFLVPANTSNSAISFMTGKEFKESNFYFDTLESLSNDTEIAYIDSVCLILDEFDENCSGLYYNAVDFVPKTKRRIRFL